MEVFKILHFDYFSVGVDFDLKTGKDKVIEMLDDIEINYLPMIKDEYLDWSGISTKQENNSLKNQLISFLDLILQFEITHKTYTIL